MWCTWEEQSHQSSKTVNTSYTHYGNRMKFILLTLFIALTSAKDDYRLPQSVIPENYKLDILTHLGPEETNFKFIGEVKIEVICIHPTSNITLHSKELQIQDNSIEVHDISSKEAKKLGIAGFDYNKGMDFFVIKLKDALQQDHKYEIRIKFTGKLTDGLAGFYRSSYEDKETKEKKWLAVTQFEATDARKAFPCFDEPSMKATYEISLGRHKNYTTLSNMPLKNTEAIQGKDGWFWDHYEKSVPMSTYLVAFLVSDFTSKQADPTGNGVVFKIWTRKDAINQVEFAKEVGPKCLSYFEKFFDIKYPLPKQDMVAMPDFNAGAMENWGLITYRETALLYDPNVSTTTAQHSISSTICHELAHQWFGNLVTMKWWTDLWLNEGFATYMAALGVDHLFPQWKSLEEEAADNLLSVYSFDALKNSHPVSVTVGNPNEIDEIFDTISYKKGSSLIRMMGEFLGESTLQKGVSNYLKKHKYNNAEQDDLWQSLTEQAHSDGVLSKELTVKAIMDTWTLQTGYPIVTVKRNYDDHSAEISQARFFRNRAQTPEGETCWWVPLTFTSKRESNFTSTHPKEWLQCPKKKQTIRSLPSDDEWVIFNTKMSGLYKVNYDKKNWALLAETLKSSSYNKIPVLNRVQLIDDAADLAWVGELKYDTFFKLLEYMEREDEYLPWRTALSNIGSLDRILRRTSMYGQFKAYMKKLLIPIYEKIGGLSIKDSSSLDTIKFQALITSWSCKYGVGECVNEALELFRKYQQNPESRDIIPKDMRRIVYCTAISRGDENEWNFLWQQYQKSNVATEKVLILSTLGCTRQIWLQKRYLDWSLDKPSIIRKQDASTVFASVASNEVGSYVAADFFFDNLHKIYKHISPNTRRLSRYLSAVAGALTTERELKELETFIKCKDNKEVFAQIKQGVDQSLENVQIRVGWRENGEQDVARILADYEKEE